MKRKLRYNGEEITIIYNDLVGYNPVLHKFNK